jgi:hypothetical protein
MVDIALIQPILLTISVKLLDKIKDAFRFSGKIECSDKKIMSVLW